MGGHGSRPKISETKNIPHRTSKRILIVAYASTPAATERARTSMGGKKNYAKCTRLKSGPIPRGLDSRELLEEIDSNSVKKG